VIGDIIALRVGRDLAERWVSPLIGHQVGLTEEGERFERSPVQRELNPTVAHSVEAVARQRLGQQIVQPRKLMCTDGLARRGLDLRAIEHMPSLAIQPVEQVAWCMRIIPQERNSCQ
jgi:hypothetical protein